MAGDPYLIPTKGDTELLLEATTASALELTSGFEWHERGDLMQQLRRTEVGEKYQPHKRVVLWWIRKHVETTGKVAIQSDRQGYYGQIGRVTLWCSDLVELAEGDDE